MIGADDVNELGWGILLGLIIGLAAGVPVGGCGGQACEREAAIKANVARWTCDPATGETRFVYGRAVP